MANVESLNKQLGRLFNGFMNAVEKKTSTEYHEWTKAVPVIRKELNIIRKKKTGTVKTEIEKALKPIPKGQESELLNVAATTPKYKVGQLVHVLLDYPENALGRKQPTAQFRMGDYRYSAFAKQVTNVLLYEKGWRFILDSNNTVSYGERELIPSSQKEIKYIVKEIIGKQIVAKKIFYKIWWKGYPKAEASLEPAESLMKDMPLLIAQYEADLKNGKRNS